MANGNEWQLNTREGGGADKNREGLPPLQEYKLARSSELIQKGAHNDLAKLAPNFSFFIY